MPQPPERLQDPLDLFAAFFVLPAEQGRQGFGVGSYDTLVASADDFTEDGDLIRQAVGPGNGRRGIVV